MWLFPDALAGEALEVDISERGLVTVYTHCVDKGSNMHSIGLFNSNTHGYFLQLTGITFE